MLSRLNLENLFGGGPSPEKPITQMNAHERLITSVKIHKINGKNYIFSSSRYEMVLIFTSVISRIFWKKIGLFRHLLVFLLNFIRVFAKYGLTYRISLNNVPA